MAGALEEAFRADLGSTHDEAESLARLARERVPALSGSADDSDEDLVLRLRDPRIFGEFAAGLTDAPELSDLVRRALAEHAFDLLPLPRTEGDVILVEARAPPRLLSLAEFLLEGDGFTLLHGMHLLYAVFLDRALVTDVDRAARTAVLRRMLVLSEAGEPLRTLYAALHLAAIPEVEAHAVLADLFRGADVSRGIKASLAGLAASEDGGRARLVEIARAEGLLPSDPTDADTTSAIASVPRLPARAAALGRRWLEKETV